MNVNLDIHFINQVDNEILRFQKSDDEFRQDLARGLDIVGINDNLSNASTSINNNVKMFLGACTRHNILFPVNYLMADDLNCYLRHIYFQELNDPIEKISTNVNAYLDKNGIYRLIHHKEYISRLRDLLKDAVSEYNIITNTLYNFNINKEGDKVVDYIINDELDDDIIHRVIACHTIYHEKMNNEEVLEKIKQKI
jgi:hypothetical protein